MKQVGSLFVVTSEEDRMRSTADLEAAKRANAEGLRKLQAVIDAHLKALADDLGAFEQTTEGRWFLNPIGIDEVLQALRDAYRSGRANDVRRLSDYIENFLEGKRNG